MKEVRRGNYPCELFFRGGIVRIATKTAAARARRRLHSRQRVPALACGGGTREREDASGKKRARGRGEKSALHRWTWEERVDARGNINHCITAAHLSRGSRVCVFHDAQPTWNDRISRSAARVRNLSGVASRVLNFFASSRYIFLPGRVERRRRNKFPPDETMR